MRMIKICDDALLLLLRIILESCMSQGIFPEVWKQANVVPICGIWRFLRINIFFVCNIKSGKK